MFNRKLKQRIRSLEELLGVVYAPGNSVKWDMAAHIPEDNWSLMRDLIDMRQEYLDNKDKKKK